ncbi:hypothetical protein KIN34_14400 [Cellulomonas sp. DKR-3]|uniref:DUF3618 domain-containing protein n=1 Tax=Cellulomonas fulva TaxID=2835530 RepID=A0ABS5U249_9CELL|nr:hypothetical protein [Cellulomonas fulva]MBT0995474.1 hypothetical protein [Cellulomonas fulva]
MSNLGRYQEIVTESARAGGVDKLIKSIESGAVAKATPGLVGKGVGLGVLLAGTAGVAVIASKRAWGSLRARRVAGDAASADLAGLVSDSESESDELERDAE